MKYLSTVLLCTGLNVFLPDYAFSNGLVLNLNVETGALTDIQDKSPQNISPSQHKPSSAPVLLAQPQKPGDTILSALEATAREFADSQVVKDANLTATEWIALFRANIAIESGYNPQALSPVGAIGLGQLMPTTASLLHVDPYSMDGNLHGSALYLLSLLKKFGSPDLAIAAYNAGPDAVEKHHGVPPFAETREHVRKVLSEFFRLRKLYSTSQGDIQIAKQ